MKKFILILILCGITNYLWSQLKFQVGDLYYTTTSDTTVEVSFHKSVSTSNYSGLTTAIIPEAVTYYGTTYSVTGIGASAFTYCSSLTSITIPNSITSIGRDAFAWCTSLTSIIIPNSVTSIGKQVFNNCTALTSITIPNSIKSIESSTFYTCTSLSSITIPNSITSIGDCAFFGCSSLTSITIPSSVTSIGKEVFAWCSSLHSIVIEEGNTIYDSRNNCNAIIETATNTLIAGCQKTIIYNSVISIGKGAFAYCHPLTSITIPNSITSIGEGAFRFCSYLTSITIPNKVADIGNYAFADCSALKTIFVDAATPPEIKQKTFHGVITSIPVYVPDESVNLYQTAPVWEMLNIQGYSNAPTGIEYKLITTPTNNCKKLFRNGQLIILHDGIEYNSIGAKL